MNMKSPIEQAAALIAALKAGKPLDRMEIRDALERLVEALKRP
jgi:hypothetical protein